MLHTCLRLASYYSSVSSGSGSGSGTSSGLFGYSGSSGSYSSGSVPSTSFLSSSKSSGSAIAMMTAIGPVIGRKIITRKVSIKFLKENAVT